MTKFPQRLRKMAFATEILDQEYLTDVNSLLPKSLRRGFLGKVTTFESWNSFGRVGSLSYPEVTGQLLGRETDCNGNVAFLRRANELCKKVGADEMAAPR
jgi:hypothetical protein